MSVGEIHVGDVGTPFKFTTRQAGRVLDISTATVKQARFKKPDGSVVVKDTEFIDSGTGGQHKYVTVEGDIDQAGKWRVQTYIEMPGRENYSDIDEFSVFPNL